MRFFNLVVMFSFLLSVTPANCWASDEKFDSEKMLTDLEKQLHLSQEKLAKLKPAIDEKSAELKKAIHESVDQGFVQLEETTRKLDAVSKDAEKKVQDFLNSEEMEQLKDYLNRIDEDAIRESKEQIIAKLTTLLALTEQQVAKLKPVLEDGMQQLFEMLDKLAKEGSSSLEEFKREYESLNDEMRKRLQEQLDNDQLDKLEDYSKERKDKIEQALFTN